jgi:predicted anti-sigma-YlaC factor YlaD
MMKLLDSSVIKHVASPRHRKAYLHHDPWEVLALSLRLVAVGLLSWDGWAHLHLWQDGYRHIPVIGPLFLVGAVNALAVAAGLLLRPSRLLGLAGAGVEIGILAGLAVSVNFGLFGFKESLSAPFAVESILVETAAVLTLVGWVILDLVRDTHPAKAPNVAQPPPKSDWPTEVKAPRG